MLNHSIKVALIAIALSACAPEVDSQSKQLEIKQAQEAYDGSTNLFDFEKERILQNETILTEDQITIDNDVSGYVHIDEGKLDILIFVESMTPYPGFVKEKLVAEIKSNIAALRELSKQYPNFPYVEILNYHISYHNNDVAGMVLEEWSRGEGYELTPIAYARTKIWVRDPSKAPEAVYEENSALLESWFDIYKTSEAEKAIADYAFPKLKTCLKNDRFYSEAERQKALNLDVVWGRGGRGFITKASLTGSTKGNKIGGLRLHLGTVFGGESSVLNGGFYVIDIPHEVFSEYLIEGWPKYFGGEIAGYQSNAMQRICNP